MRKDGTSTSQDALLVATHWWWVYKAECMYPNSLSQVSGKKQSVLWMGRQPASLPTGQAGRTEFHGVTELCCTQAFWPNCPQPIAVLQREFKMPIYISALPGEVCRNTARLLAMQCTSAAPDIIRINPGWEHGAEALPLKTLEGDPTDWLQTPLVQSKVRNIKLHLKNHTRHFHFILYQNKNWINSPRRDKHLTSCLVLMCQWNSTSHVTRHILL